MHKKFLILILLLLVSGIVIFFSYSYIFEFFFSEFDLIKRADDLRIFKVDMVHSSKNIPQVKDFSDSPIIFTALKEPGKRDIFCLYSDGRIFNITNTDSLNELKMNTAYNGNYIVFELLQKRRNIRSIGFIDIMAEKYYIIETPVHAGHLVTSPESPHIAFTNTIGDRWELIVFDLSRLEIIYKNHHPDHNCMPQNFSLCGNYLYWTMGYPLKDRVKDIMATDMRSLETETLEPHNNRIISSIVPAENGLYFASTDIDSDDRSIFYHSFITGESDLHKSNDEKSLFPYKVSDNYMVISNQIDISDDLKDPDSEYRQSALRRLFRVYEYYTIIDRETKETLKSIHNCLSLSFHPEYDHIIIYTVFIDGKGFNIVYYNVLTEQSFMIENIPYDRVNYPLFLIKSGEYHFWLK